MELVLATKHWHKIREIKHILKAMSSLDVYSLYDFPQVSLPIIEKEAPLEMAKQIALSVAKQTQKWALADCSLLRIPVIDALFGSFSEDFVDKDQQMLRLRKQILKELENTPSGERSAYLECNMALASPSKLEKQARSICEGFIAPKELGGNGHGYDFIFIKNGYDKTFSQMSEDFKNKISHRRKALDNISLTLESLQPV